MILFSKLNKKYLRYFDHTNKHFYNKNKSFSGRPDARFSQNKNTACQALCRSGEVDGMLRHGSTTVGQSIEHGHSVANPRSTALSGVSLLPVHHRFVITLAPAFGSSTDRFAEVPYHEMSPANPRNGPGAFKERVGSRDTPAYHTAIQDRTSSPPKRQVKVSLIYVLTREVYLPVLPFYPKHRSFHPKNCSFSLSNKTFSGSKYPENI